VAELNFGQVLKPIWTGPSPKSGRKIGPPGPHHFIKSFLDSLRPVFGVCTLNTTHNSTKKNLSSQFSTFPQKFIFFFKKILNTARGAMRRPVRSPSGERQCAPVGLSDDLERPAFSSPVLQQKLLVPSNENKTKNTLALSILNSRQNNH